MDNTTTILILMWVLACWIGSAFWLALDTYATKNNLQGIRALQSYVCFMFFSGLSYYAYMAERSGWWVAGGCLLAVISLGLFFNIIQKIAEE